ncbi:MAG: hypothetical protein ACXVB0_13195 [Mucilaginibacter sp.]
MKFFPYEIFYITTSLKPAEVQDRLSKEVEPPQRLSFKNLFSFGSGAYFSGYVVNGTFECKRMINYRNSFLPIIKGTTETYLNGSRLHVKMSMHIAVVIFMCFWLGGVGVFGIGFLLQNYSKGGFEPASLIPVGMFVFGYVLATSAFKFESTKAKDKLLEILDGKIVK